MALSLNRRRTAAFGTVCERSSSVIERTSFGTAPDGSPVSSYLMTAGRARVRVSDFGATLLGVEVPDASGELADVVLGFGGIEGYAGENGACYGATIGPMANRTDRAEVPISGTVFHLTRNDGPDGANNLHSDLEHGLHKRVWAASVDEARNAVEMTLTLSDGELGLPGNRTFSARYELDEADGIAELRVTYGCVTDARTCVNMTNHAYFNLSGHDSGTITEHMAAIDADAFLPLREDCVSAGEVLAVEGTPFDFRSARPLGEMIDADCDQTRIARGYDQCFCVRGYEPDSEPRHALRLEDPASGRALDVLITAPGAHLYTGNWLSDTDAKAGATYGPRSGVAFEPEFYPDFVHHPEWPQSVCSPEHPYSSKIVYRFSTLGQ